MADSAEDICNLALLHIGHSRFVESLATDGTEEADVCNASYAQCRDEVLQLAPWPFAMRRMKPAPIVATTLSAGAVPGGWSYAYALPSDDVSKGLVRIFGASPVPLPRDEIPFAVEYDDALGAQVLLTNVDAPEFVYTSRITDPKLFSPLFVRAVAWRLSVDLVLGLRKDPKVGVMAMQAFKAALGESRAAALGAVQTPQPVPGHIAAR